MSRGVCFDAFFVTNMCLEPIKHTTVYTCIWMKQRLPCIALIVPFSTIRTNTETGSHRKWIDRGGEKSERINKYLCDLLFVILLMGFIWALQRFCATTKAPSTIVYVCAYFFHSFTLSHAFSSIFLFLFILSLYWVNKHTHKCIYSVLSSSPDKSSMNFVWVSERERAWENERFIHFFLLLLLLFVYFSQKHSVYLHVYGG